MKYFDKALAVNPKNVVALNGKGDALEDLRNYTGAILYYDKALAIDPNDKNALDNKGLALDNLGNHAEAIEYYNKASSCASTNMTASNTTSSTSTPSSLTPQHETQGIMDSYDYGKSTTWYFSNETTNDVETGKIVFHISLGDPLQVDNFTETIDGSGKTLKGVWEQEAPSFNLVHICDRAIASGVYYYPSFNSHCVSYNITRSNTNDMIQLQSNSGVTVDLSPTSINDPS